jgi:hypothetical protein
VALKSIDNSAEKQPIVRPRLGRNAAIYVASLALVAIAFLLRSLLAPTLAGQALYPVSCASRACRRSLPGTATSDSRSRR